MIEQCNDQWKALMALDADPEGVSRACTQTESSAKVRHVKKLTVLFDDKPEIAYKRVKLAISDLR